MKLIFEFFRKVFDCQLSRLFFVANFIICPVVFYWIKISGYYNELNELGCKPKPRPAVSFGVYDLKESINSFDEASFILFLVLVAGLFLIFFAPPVMVCGIISAVLKFSNPALCDEKNLITRPIFMVANGIYWILLGYLIESVYLKTTQNKPARKNPLSIYSG